MHIQSFEDVNGSCAEGPVLTALLALFYIENLPGFLILKTHSNPFYWIGSFEEEVCGLLKKKDI